MRALLRAGGRKLLGLSVVIPALNAAATLQSCLVSLEGAAEIVVVDGGSTDGTLDIAQAAGVRLVHSEPGRGPQLMRGAETARGEWLLFLHADTMLEPGWREAAQDHMERYPDSAGCFRFRLDDSAWQARLIERGVALRTRLGLPYGDQGLIVPRDLYEWMGGYKALPLMEDVDLVARIGRKRLRVLAADAVTSAERWRRDGWIGRSGGNLLLLGLYYAGVSPDRLARLYSPR